MVKYIEYKKFCLKKRAQTPFIIYFQKENDEYSRNVLSTLERLHKFFPLVLCYCLKRQNFPLRVSENEYISYENVYSYRNTKLDKDVPGTSYSELFDLFNYVFNDSIYNFKRGLLITLKAEGVVNFNFNEVDKLLPNYKNLLKYHKYILYQPVSHKYSDSETKYLSTLKDCNFEKYNKKFSEIFCLQEMNQNTSDQKNEHIVNPKFPAPDIEFRAPSPVYVKESDSFIQKNLRKMSSFILKNINKRKNHPYIGSKFY